MPEPEHFKTNISPPLLMKGSHTKRDVPAAPAGPTGRTIFASHGPHGGPRGDGTEGDNNTKIG